MKEKKCYSCKQKKDINSFYKRKDSKDGHASLCKKCAKTKGKIYRKKNKKRIYARKKLYRQKNRLKRNAESKLFRAIASGLIHRAVFCECCNKEEVTEGHHNDYNKPLMVVWLCPTCHSNYHIGISKEADIIRGKVNHLYSKLMTKRILDKVSDSILYYCTRCAITFGLNSDGGMINHEGVFCSNCASIKLDELLKHKEPAHVD